MILHYHQLMRHQLRTSTSLIAVALSVGILSAQTRIIPPDNKYTPAQDVQLGQEAAAQVRKEYPLLNDATTERLVDRIGQRLAQSIPAEYRQPAFRYSFEDRKSVV